MTFSHVERPAAPQPISPGGRASKWTLGSSISEAIAGGISVVLAVLGLLGLMATSLAAIAAMSIGVALLADAWTMAEHFRQGVETARVPQGKSNVREGLRIESIGGVLSLVLGTLALFGVAPLVLLSANSVAMGLILLFAGGVSVEVDATALDREFDIRKRHTEELFIASSTGRIVAAIASIVLGVVALNTLAQAVTFVLIAQLGIGTVILLSGSAIAGWTQLKTSRSS